MAEAFQLLDEPSGVAFGVLGVAAVEEPFAEFVVGDALVEDVVGGGEDFWAVAIVALALKRRAR